MLSPPSFPHFTQVTATLQATSIAPCKIEYTWLWKSKSLHHIFCSVGQWTELVLACWAIGDEVTSLRACHEMHLPRCKGSVAPCVAISNRKWWTCTGLQIPSVHAFIAALEHAELQDGGEVIKNNFVWETYYTLERFYFILILHAMRIIYKTKPVFIVLLWHSCDLSTICHAD